MFNRSVLVLVLVLATAIAPRAFAQQAPQISDAARTFAIAREATEEQNLWAQVYDQSILIQNLQKQIAALTAEKAPPKVPPAK